ncbi:MAG: NADH-quinone oxidoreductase subunit J [Deltaproteobacteria bacterium]|nr:NADH-quinone oxidoreductase subunit J [Deltaproteobacteria bacterium]
MEDIVWYLLSTVALLSAIAVVMIPKPLYSAFALVLHMFMIAGLFAMLDAHFLATAQIIVYAGAIMVLVIFVIMLLSLQGAEERPSLLFSVASFAIVAALARYIVPRLDAAFGSSGTDLAGTVKSVGELLYTKYIFPFEAASVLIMVAIVGAVILSKREKKDAA